MNPQIVNADLNGKGRRMFARLINRGNPVMCWSTWNRQRYIFVLDEMVSLENVSIDEGSETQSHRPKSIYKVLLPCLLGEYIYVVMNRKCR